MRIKLVLLAAVMITGNATAMTVVSANAEGRDLIAVADRPQMVVPNLGPPAPNVPANVSVVPEAATWAMLVAGFAAVGVLTRRRINRGVRSVSS